MYYPESEPTQITVREVAYDPLRKSRTRPQTPKRSVQSIVAGSWVVWLIVFVVIGFLGTMGARAVYLGLPEQEVVVIVPNETETSAVVAIQSETLSPVFTDEVQFWKADILRWAKAYEIDPNLIATVIQIESCGDPNAGSSAGAQGLFQVMPFHFTADEQTRMKDPETNAIRGLNYLKEGLKKANGHAGLALAGYNGGHGVIEWGWAKMYNETRRYYYWGTGIYEDAISGKTSSERLNEWLNAGGRSLCSQAARTQQSLGR